MATRTISRPGPGLHRHPGRGRLPRRRGEVDADNAAALAYFARHGYPVDTARRRAAGAVEGEGGRARAVEADEPPVEADPEPEG